VFKTRFTY